METKALGQLHFKYYAEVRGTQNVNRRQVPRCSLTLWKEVCFPAYPAFRLLNYGVHSSLVFWPKYMSVTEKTSGLSVPL